LDTLDITKYIQTVLKTIDGQNYLIDENGIVFKFDTYDIAGQVIKNEIIWF
jgi:Skp family chaperone for outer membrane proteins